MILWILYSQVPGFHLVVFHFKGKKAFQVLVISVTDSLLAFLPTLFLTYSIFQPDGRPGFFRFCSHYYYYYFFFCFSPHALKATDSYWRDLIVGSLAKLASIRSQQFSLRLYWEKSCLLKTQFRCHLFWCQFTLWWQILFCFYSIAYPMFTVKWNGWILALCVYLVARSIFQACIRVSCLCLLLNDKLLAVPSYSTRSVNVELNFPVVYMHYCCLSVW